MSVRIVASFKNAAYHDIFKLDFNIAKGVPEFAANPIFSNYITITG